MRCTFPYGQKGEWQSGGATLVDAFTYVFHESDVGRVSSQISRGAPMTPRIFLRVELSKKSLPAELQWVGREPRRLVRESSLIMIKLPDNGKGVLKSGDWKVTLKNKSGNVEFLVGVDKDGTPTAATGYVRRTD